MPTLQEILAKGGELDPALKRSRLEALYGPNYQQYITPEGNFEIPIGSTGPVTQGPLEGPQGPAPFTRGIKTVAQDLLNAGGLLSGAVGLETWSEALYEKAQDYANAVDKIPQRIARVEDIQTIKDAAIYAYERIAENVPMLASLMIPAGLVGVGARGLGMSATAARAAGWSSGFLTDVGLQTGESVEIARRAGENPEDIRVVGSGIGKAMLDFVPFFALARKMGLGPSFQTQVVKVLTEKGYLKRAAGTVGTLIATEVPTEVAQESINIALDRSLQGKQGDLTPEEISQLKNAAAGALAVSLGLGAVSGIHTPRPATDEELYGGQDAATPASEALVTPSMQTEPSPVVAPQSGVLPGEGIDTLRSGGWEQWNYDQLFNEKTGEMIVTGREYMKRLIEQGREIKYDPFSNELSGTDMRPGLTPTRTGWFFDAQQGGFIYDQGKAKIQMNEQGFSSWLQDGTFLGTTPDLAQAMQRAEKFAYDSEPITGVDNNGEYRYEQQDPQKKLALSLQQQPQMTPTEMAVVSIENAKPENKPEAFDIPEDEAVLIKQLDPGMQRLLESRMEFLADKDNYRTTDNQLKNSAATALTKIDARIETYAKRLGIPNPVRNDTGLETREDIENVFAERSAEEGKQKKYPNLTDAESSILDALEEKEREPGAGLTLKEYEKLERLIAKRAQDIGVPQNERERITEDQVQEMIEIAKKKFRKEYKILRKGPDGIMAAPRDPDMEPNGDEFEFNGDEFDEEFVDDEAGIDEMLAEAYARYKTKGTFQNYNKQQFLDNVADAIASYGGIPGDPTQLEMAAKEAYDRKLALAQRRNNKRVLLGVKEIGIIESNGEKYLGILSSGEPVGSYDSEQQAADAIIDHDISTRTDFTRGAAVAREARNMGGQLAQSLLTPERRKLEMEMIKAVRKMYDSLQIKPAITFAHSWNTDIFSEGSTIQKAVKSYRGFVQFRDAGRIYMILDNLKDVRAAERTFAHEVIAHFGLRAYFAPKELQKLLELVIKHRGDEVFQHRQRYAQGTAEGAPVGQITLDQAEEFVASKFEEFHANQSNGNTTFVEKFLALVRRFLGHLNFFKASDKELAAIFKDVGSALRQGVIRNNNRGFWWSHHQAKEPLAAVIGRDAARVAEGDINSLGEVWRAKTQLGILTPLQIAERYNVDGAKAYIETTQLWWARKRTLTNGATEVAERWQKIPKKHAERLSAFIFETTEKSDELGRRLTPEELGELFKKHNVTKDAADLYGKIDSEFQNVLTNLETGLKRAVLRQHARSREEAETLFNLWNKPDKQEFLSASKDVMGNLELGARLSDIENQINHMRSRNYFPYSRFGQYALTVRAKGDFNWKGQPVRGPRDEKRGEVVHFETFESAKAQKERFESLKKEFPAHLFNLRASVVSEEEFSFLGMPPALLDLIRNHVQLTDQQTENLKELFYLRSPGRAFLRHLVKRRGTAGYSQDALRVFASYMMNAGNHIARIEFNPDLTDHLTTMRKFAEENGNVAGIVSNYFQKHHSYLMNPQNDLAQLRALGFLWYLGFNVKSALVNLTQVPMVAYPYLSSVYGDVKSVGALSNAYKRVVDWRRGKSVLSKEAETAIARGISEGFLDESRATELAGLAEGGVLHRILPFDKSARVLNQTAYYGSYLFRHAEKFNREVVFLATLELAKARGMDGENAFKAARKAVQTTMFEYAKWNRPTFMRGKKSVFFLFWNYMQHLTYLAFGGEGRKPAIRVNLMLLAAAGLQGLPFAENILDLIDWGSTEVKEALGSEDPRTDLRTDIRELALTITDRPDLVMHGLSRYYGLGAFHALELLGVPVPQVDVSGSLSAGEPIPGIGELVEPSRDPDKKLGAALISALGPVAGIGYTFWKSMMSQDPDQWKTWERAMPSALRVASQAARRSDRDAETFRGGGAILEFDPLNSEHRAELIANSLGFSPSRLTQSYELRSAQEDLRRYWTVRRAMVLENYAYAMMSEDVEVKADAVEAMKRYNRDVPAPQLRLSPQQVMQSLRQRTRLRTLREQGLPNERAFQPLYAAQERLYGGEE